MWKNRKLERKKKSKGNDLEFFWSSFSTWADAAVDAAENSVRFFSFLAFYSRAIVKSRKNGRSVLIKCRCVEYSIIFQPLKSNLSRHSICGRVIIERIHAIALQNQLMMIVKHHPASSGNFFLFFMFTLLIHNIWELWFVFVLCLLATRNDTPDTLATRKQKQHTTKISWACENHVKCNHECDICAWNCWA